MMGDEISDQAPAETPARRGWPKGVKRGPRKRVEPLPTREPLRAATRQAPTTRPKMKARPNWDADVISDYEDSPDRLHIPAELVPEGMSLQWVTHSVYGQPQAQHRASFERKGWTPIHQSDFDGIFDGMFMPKGADGEINMEGLVLMARPVEITAKARARDEKRARDEVSIKERQVTGGGMQAAGAAHPSAVRQNRINKSMETIEIPD